MCFTTGQSIFAEGLRICRGKMLGHSAKSLWPSAKNSPRQRLFAEGQTLGKDKHTATIILCRGLSPRQRAGPRQHHLTRLPSPAINLCRGHYRQALGKDFLTVFDFFFKKNLCRVPLAQHSAKTVFAECQDGTRQIFSFFFVFFTPNFLLGPPTLFTTSCSNLVFFLVFLLYLVD